ncbi:MAG: hypothetical protein F6K04_26800 [Leptolyngbya sp. SIO4C5]|nr:hypothetical protein [Leptolyngbya sp. SIO4C5]
MSGNHRTAKPSSARTALDHVLADKPDAVQARLRKLVQEFNIHPNDPLWPVILSLEQVTGLIEAGPKEWQHLFAEFQEELTAWTNSHLQTLTALAHEAEALQQLAQNSEQTSVVMQTLAAQSQTLSQQLQYSTESLAGLLNEWQGVTNQLKQQQAERQAITAMQKEQLSMLVKAVQHLDQKLDRPSFLRQSSWRGTTLAIAVLYTLVFSVVSMTTLVLYLKDRPLLLEMHEPVMDGGKSARLVIDT